MKSWIFGAITLSWLAFGGAAIACPVGNGEGAIRPTRPVVQNVSLQASEMIERASQLESAASSRDVTARAFEQEADTLSSRARILRNQAGLVNVADRSSILAIADELSLRAASSRTRAAEERAQASDLRIEAQEPPPARDRARPGHEQRRRRRLAHANDEHAAPLRARGDALISRGFLTSLAGLRVDHVTTGRPEERPRTALSARMYWRRHPARDVR